MGFYRTYYIVVGVRMSEEDFEKHFDNPSESELPGRLAVIDGGEADIDDVVIGQVVQKIDKYKEIPEVKDLTAAWEHNITVGNDLEEMGIFPADDVPVEFPRQSKPHVYSITSVRHQIFAFPSWIILHHQSPRLEDWTQNRQNWTKKFDLFCWIMLILIIV